MDFAELIGVARVKVRWQKAELSGRLQKVKEFNPMDQKDIYTNLLWESFKNDSGIQTQLSGIQNPDHIFCANCKGEIEAFAQLGLISSVDGDGLLIGYSSELAQSAAFADAMQQIPKFLLQEASEEDVFIFQNNTMKLAEIAQGDWHIKFTGDAPVYMIHTVLVRPDMKGKGVLRKLFSPVFDQCTSENRMIVLQTHSYDTVAIYEHFGFELMETVRSDKRDIGCYNMLKRVC